MKYRNPKFWEIKQMCHLNTVLKISIQKVVELSDGLKEYAQGKEEIKNYENTTENTCRTLENLHDMFEGVPRLIIYKTEDQVWVLIVSQSSTANKMFYLLWLLQ